MVKLKLGAWGEMNREALLPDKQEMLVSRSLAAASCSACRPPSKHTCMADDEPRTSFNVQALLW